MPKLNLNVSVSSVCSLNNGMAKEKVIGPTGVRMVKKIEKNPINRGKRMVIGPILMKMEERKGLKLILMGNLVAS